MSLISNCMLLFFYSCRTWCGRWRAQRQTAVISLSKTSLSTIVAKSRWRSHSQWPRSNCATASAILRRDWAGLEGEEEGGWVVVVLEESCRPPSFFQPCGPGEGALGSLPLVSASLKHHKSIKIKQSPRHSGPETNEHSKMHFTVRCFL